MGATFQFATIDAALRSAAHGIAAMAATVSVALINWTSRGFIVIVSVIVTSNLAAKREGE